MAKRQTKNKSKRSVLAPSPPQMVILRVCMVLLALLLAAITLLNRGSDTVMNTAYPRKYDEYVTYYAGKYQIDPYILYSWRTASIRRMARYWMLSRTRKCAAMCKK